MSRKKTRHTSTPANASPPRGRLDGPATPLRAPSAGSALFGQRPPGHAPDHYLDGAAARHAADTITPTPDLIDDVSARSASGHPLDDAAPHGEGSMLAKPRALIRRASSSMSAALPSQLLTLSARLRKPGALSRWIRDHRMRTRSEVVDPFGLDPAVSERWRPLFEFLYRRWWHVETTGMLHVPDFGRALVVANHGGTLPYDSLMLMYALRYDHPAHRTLRPLIEDVVYQLPFLGVHLNRLGCVRASQQNAEQLMDRSALVAVFPEGGKGTSKLYKNRYRLQRFGRGGFVKLALRTGAPIIPTALLGPEDAHPLVARLGLGPKSILPFLPITPTFPWLGPLGLIPRRDRWLIAFGEPIDVSKEDPASEHNSLLVTQINDRVRTAIQRMLDELVERRRHLDATQEPAPATEPTPREAR